MVHGLKKVGNHCSNHCTIAPVADLAHLYCDSTVGSRDLTMLKECFRAINRLRKNDDIVITKPDLGSGASLLNKSDFVDKMNEILDDQSKFKRLGPVSSNDNTASIESRLQKRLLDLVKADLMPKWIYDAIRPRMDRKDLECMVCRKHTKKAFHFALYCL